MPTKEELIQEMIDGVVNFAEDQVRQAAQQYINDGHDPVAGILGGLSAGMMKVGELFAAQEYFVPEVLLCADAMDEGLKVLKPHIRKVEGAAGKGTVVLGAVEGDVHDIGKNMVKLMLEVNGYTVHDLGTDVPVSQFVDEMKRVKADIVGLSAMMTTTMMVMKKIVPALKAVDPEIRVLLGGATVTRDIVCLFGADGYADDAVGAVHEADRVMQGKRLENMAGCGSKG
jgi:corrinoid protein of di/trimethylamine methyltransferase